MEIQYLIAISSRILLALSFVTSVFGADDTTVEAPSRLFRKPDANIPNLAIFSSSQNDLRQLFSTKEGLAGRIKNQQCVFDFFGSESLLLKVGIGRGLDSLLIEQQRSWQGQPQIRVIKKNSIVQNNLFDKNVTDFLQIRIEPGDIVIFCAFAE